jgi:predicted ribosome quality control (RQC) complex YloA/Tae2 family protein
LGQAEPTSNRNWIREMYDALTIAAITDELNALLVDARIQGVAQIDALSVVLEVYARHRRWWLTLSADPQLARVVLSDERVAGDAERVTPLLLLLRKYARGGRIVSVSQPRYERILRVSIAKPLEGDKHEDVEDIGGAPQDLAYTELVAELMGRRSNLIYLDAHGRILEAAKRVTSSMSRVRTVRPNQPYTPPPPQDKLEPRLATPQRLLAAARDMGASQPPAQPVAVDVDKWLVANIAALSPTLAREVVLRAGIDESFTIEQLTAEKATQLAAAIRSLFTPLDTGTWEPMVYELPHGRAVATPIALHTLAARAEAAAPYERMSEAVLAALARDSGIDEPAPAPGRHHARQQRLVAEIDDARDRLAHRLDSLREQQQHGATSERWRTFGEAIYANVASITRGERELRTPDGLIIELDPTLSASENAQRYFERYRKAQSATEHVPSLVTAAEQELAYVLQLLSTARLAETYDEIELARQEWQAYSAQHPGRASASRPTGAKPAAAARRPRAFRTTHGDAILVGRTGPQNETVTFEMAGPDDLWLHARNMPGAHVILRVSGEAAPAAIERAAALAAYYSDGRGSTSVPVDVTQRRHVRKIKGAGPGMVTYRNERTLNVRPLPEGELDLAPTKS